MLFHLINGNLTLFSDVILVQSSNFNHIQSNECLFGNSNPTSLFLSRLEVKVKQKVKVKVVDQKLLQVDNNQHKDRWMENKRSI